MVFQTGKVLAASLYYLASNKGSQQKLRKELLQLLPSKHTQITSSVLDQAQYLKAVVKEVARLAAIAVGNLRATNKDLVLCGYQIPKGVRLLTNKELKKIVHFVLKMFHESYISCS